MYEFPSELSSTNNYVYYSVSDRFYMHWEKYYYYYYTAVLHGRRTLYGSTF